MSIVSAAHPQESTTMEHEAFMREAINLSERVLREGAGGPFGCVIVRNGTVVGRGSNKVTVDCDPTAHAEVVAIRDACANLKTFHLQDCVLYTSCEPCPMCLSAVYWARIPTVYYGNNRRDAADIGFDDDFLYQQVPLAPEHRTLTMIPLLRGEALVAFQGWANLAEKIDY